MKELLLAPIKPLVQVVLWVGHLSRELSAFFGLGGGVDPAFSQQIFNIPIAQSKTSVKPDSVANDVGRDTVPGDPAVGHIEIRLGAQPSISVPTITIDGDVDGVRTGTKIHAGHFNGSHAHRVFEQVGHTLSQERLSEWAQTVLDARETAIG